jgi:hypothetical protein
MVQQAGSEGLAPCQIKALTEHMLKKVHSTYQSECAKEILKVMSYQGRQEYHFVEHQYLNAANNKFTVMEYTYFLLPNYDTWVQKSQWANRDKSLSCCKFLFDFIPYLMEAPVQDRILFDIDCLNHPMSHLLKVKINCLMSFLNKLPLLY